MAIDIRSKINNSGILGENLLVKRTKKKAVLAFMQSLSPIETEHQLVRIGGVADGGYLVPDDLIGINAVFSPGVADTADFESAFASRGVRCFLADYSVDAPPISSPLFHFEKKFLGARTEGINVALDDWVKLHAPIGDDLILQMDIEGAEYGVLLSADQATLRRFRIIILEVHGLESVWQPKGLELIDCMFQKLLLHFDVVHLHPNNCLPLQGFGEVLIPPVMEVTLLRKDRTQTRRPVQMLPHSLDRKNVPDFADYALPACWYKQRP